MARDARRKQQETNKTKQKWEIRDLDIDNVGFIISKDFLVESPVNWTEWTNYGSVETPYLRLKDPLSVPPLHVTLLPSSPHDKPFYEGHYLLDIHSLEDDYPRYIKDDSPYISWHETMKKRKSGTNDPHTFLFFNSETKWWKLGDSELVDG